MDTKVLYCLHPNNPSLLSFLYLPEYSLIFPKVSLTRRHEFLQIRSRGSCIVYTLLIKNLLSVLSSFFPSPCLLLSFSFPPFLCSYDKNQGTGLSYTLHFSTRQRPSFGKFTSHNHSPKTLCLGTLVPE